MDFKIEDNATLPVGYKRNSRPPKYPFLDMKPGQSFFVPGGKREKLFSNIFQFRKARNLKDWIFDVIEQEEEIEGVMVAGARVWRDPLHEEKEPKSTEEGTADVDGFGNSSSVTASKIRSHINKPS